MKSLFCLFVNVCILTNAKAQFEKGQKMITGQFSFGYQTIQHTSAFPSSSSSNFFTSFTLSRFTTPTTIKSFGVNLGYSGNSGNYDERSLGVCYNFTKLQKLANRFYLTFPGNATIEYGELINGVSEQTYVSTDASVGIGLLYLTTIGSNQIKVDLEAILKYAQ